ncbi:sugar ABC transporter permease, partial [Anaerovibrio lipolyticus]
MENEVAARNKKIKHAIMIIVLTLLFIAFVFPFIMVIMNVFKVKADITANPLALIGKHGFTLENFPNAIKKMNFFKVFGNSLFVTILSTIGTIILSSMTAYLIVRNNWKANKILFVLMIASMVIPFQVLMVP